MISQSINQEEAKEDIYGHHLDTSLNPILKQNQSLLFNPYDSILEEDKEEEDVVSEKDTVSEAESGY